jgi:hypothetical protein
MAVSFFGRGTEYPEKTTDLPQVTDKLLSHISSTPRLSGIPTVKIRILYIFPEGIM